MCCADEREYNNSLSTTKNLVSHTSFSTYVLVYMYTSTYCGYIAFFFLKDFPNLVRKLKKTKQYILCMVGRIYAEKITLVRLLLFAHVTVGGVSRVGGTLQGTLLSVEW